VRCTNDAVRGHSAFPRVEREGEVVQDTFIGEQTLVANVRDRRASSSSRRARTAGSLAFCRIHPVPGIDKVHAVIGGFTLGLSGERIEQAVVDASRAMGLDYSCAQHCNGLEAVWRLTVTSPVGAGRDVDRHHVHVRGAGTRVPRCMGPGRRSTPEASCATRRARANCSGARLDFVERSSGRQALADLRLEQPTKFDLVINLKVARPSG